MAEKGVARKRGKNGNKKHGRNEVKCQRYLRNVRLERNRNRRVARFEAMVVESRKRHLAQLQAHDAPVPAVVAAA